MKNLYGSNIGSYFLIIKILKLQGHTYNEFTFHFFCSYAKFWNILLRINCQMNKSLESKKVERHWSRWPQN